jgi:hypothetical protein
MKKIGTQTLQAKNSSLPGSIRINWLTRLFGCWHPKMGSPFTRGNETYCTCRECGACRKFDMVRWKSVGPYYYNTVVALYDTPLLIKSSDFNLEISAFEIDRWVADGGGTKDNGENRK